MAPSTTTTEVDRPPEEAFRRGIDGPIRAIVVTVDPIDAGRRSRLTINLDFEGHGIGKLLVSLAVRRQARNEMPTNLRALKEHLENPEAGVARAAKSSLR
jgi:hypothetical protein